jgi:hypothetical protein
MSLATGRAACQADAAANAAQATIASVAAHRVAGRVDR